MLSINTNLQSLIVQNNLTKSSNTLNQAIERMTTGFKLNHASDNAANYSISQSMSSKLSSYDMAAQNTAMGIDMIETASNTIENMASGTARLKELCVQAQNGTYGKQSIDAIKSEANSIISHIVTQYKSAEYNGVQLFDIYSDKIAQLEAESGEKIGLSSDISADNNGFISDPKTYTDEQVAAMTTLSSVSASTTISSGTYSVSSADDLAKLAEMVNNGKVTGGEFVLANDVDLSSWCAEHTAADGTGGWTAIGKDYSHSFKGTFDGNGHTVSGLYINKETSDYQGLFGYTATGSTIKNVGVEGDVKGRRFTGALAGFASDAITNSYATGSVSGTGSVGGLAGGANTITNSYATGTVSGTGNQVGGLAGLANNTITNSYATGTVSGTGNQVGGLAGYANNTITNSYATGTVSGTGSVGGLVGYAYITITNSYATGNVSGTNNVGGLAGLATNTITNSYATGDVSSTGSANGGISFTGGLVGRLNKTSGRLEYKNNASFGKVTASVEAGSGSLIGGIVNTTNGTSFAIITLTNQMTTSQLDAIGGAYKYASSTYTAVDKPEKMETWNSNISKFNAQTQLQVGINGNESSQIVTQTNLNIGIIKQLESLDVSKSSSLDFLDSFLDQLNSKSTEFGAASNRLESALESIEVSINNLTSSRSTIKDADIAKESSQYIKAQILQQASATLLATANQTPALTLQLLNGLR